MQALVLRAAACERTRHGLSDLNLSNNKYASLPEAMQSFNDFIRYDLPADGYIVKKSNKATCFHRCSYTIVHLLYGYILQHSVHALN
jgi:hypothetical protein